MQNKYAIKWIKSLRKPIPVDQEKVYLENH